MDYPGPGKDLPDSRPVRALIRSQR